jgi:hypothetical protein
MVKCQKTPIRASWTLDSVTAPRPRTSGVAGRREVVADGDLGQSGSEAFQVGFGLLDLGVGDVAPSFLLHVYGPPVRGDSAGRRPEAVHQEVQQATGLGFMLGPGGHGEDADEGGGDVFGGDVAAQVACRAAGVEDGGDGRQ